MWFRLLPAARKDPLRLHVTVLADFLPHLMEAPGNILIL